MAIVKKKVWKEYWDSLASGKKKYDLRLDDFEVKEGDTLVLEEWDKDKKEYTGRKMEKKITYLSHLKMDGSSYFWSKEELLEKGIVIMSLE